MTVDAQTAFVRKYIDFLKQLNLYLNHFPRHEKYALCQSIRQDAYNVFDLMVEGQKRYYKKTSLSNMDVQFEQLKAKILLAYHLGYFEFKDGKTDEKNPTTMSEKRRKSMVTPSGTIRICLCPIVGGNWNNSGLSGVRTRNLNNVRSNSNNNVGGRDCDFTLEEFEMVQKLLNKIQRSLI